MTASEAGVRGLKPTPERGVGIFTFHKLAGFPRVTERPSPILYWDSGKSENTLYKTRGSRCFHSALPALKSGSYSGFRVPAPRA